MSVKSKKAQALIICLWILAILTVLAVSIGHRVSLGLRFSRYSRDRVKAYALARAGIQRGIVELQDDKVQSQYDALSETWSTGKDLLTNRQLFENVEIRQGSGEVFTLKEYYDGQEALCMSDEEHKININTASSGLLFNLLEELHLQIQDVQELVRYIRIWRGDNEQALHADEASFSHFKKKPLVVPEELLLILSFYYHQKGLADFQAKAKEAYAHLKYLITVFATDIEIKVNINTASRAVLSILTKSKAENDLERQSIEDLINRIIEKRPFEDIARSFDAFEDELEGIGTEEKNLFNRMREFLIVSSDYFRISSTGNAGEVSQEITAVYNRKEKKIIYWHEYL